MERRSSRGIFASALLVFSFFILFSSATTRAEETPRQWINTKGRSVVATLITADREHCTLRLAGGETSTVAIADLDAEGAAYVESWIAEKEKRGETVASIPAAWPKKASAGANSRVEPVKRDAATGAYVYRSRHFEMRSDVELLSGTVSEFAAIFEATLAALEALPVGLDPKPPANRYRVFLFLDDTAYRSAGAPAGSAGFYNGATRSLIISLTNLGFAVDNQRIRLDYRRNLFVLKHEAAHQVLGAWMGRFPVWMNEGWAEYIAAIPYENGTYYFTNSAESTKRYLNRWRPGEDQRRIPFLHPKTVMQLNFSQWMSDITSERVILNYNSVGLLVHYFLHFDGDGRGTGMAAYLATLRDARNYIELRHRARAGQEEFLLRGRSHDQLAADIAEAWKKHGLLLQVQVQGE